MSGTDLVVVQLDRARTALIEAQSLQQVKSVLDVAAAAQVYAQRQRLGQEAVQYASDIRLDAERKLGEMLRETPKATGGDAQRTRFQKGTESPPTLAEIGIDRKTSMRAQRIAALPEEKFQEVKNGKTTVASAIHRHKRSRTIETINARSIPTVSDFSRTAKAPVLFCDPPWRYEYSETESRAIENQYPTMSIDEICAIRLYEITQDDCILFLWATSPKLAEAMRVIEAWGFTYRTCAVWDKEVIGMGYYFRQQHELLLVATKGNLPTPLPENRPPSVLRERRSDHSVKPIIAYEYIERMYPELVKAELFQREPRDGWLGWGKEAVNAA